jgi:hypothetical protein
MLYCPLFQSNKNKYFENYQIIKILSKPKLNFQIDNTDAEGRLILADALCYAQTLDPRIVVDLATLTGAIGVALGPATCGVFTNSNK